MRFYYTYLFMIAFVVLLIFSACQNGTQDQDLPGVFLGDFQPGIYQNPEMSWTWDFRADGTYFAQGVFKTERGSFTVTGDQIIMKGDSCGEITGTYTWTNDGQDLNFSVVEDECADRRIVLGNSPWFLTPEK